MVEIITNLTLYVYKIPDHPIGLPNVELPDYIQKNRAIISLANDPNKVQTPYRDNLCFFRCLALHQGTHRKSLENAAKELFQRYLPDCNPTDFPGVTLKDISKLEEVFGVNIVIYEMIELDNEDMNKVTNDDEVDGQPASVVVGLVQRSLDRYEETMYLNLYRKHFSFISDINKYNKSFRCRKCHKLRHL